MLQVSAPLTHALDEETGRTESHHGSSGPLGSTFGRHRLKSPEV